ncbi:MAG: hypothetical protein RQ753_07185, partial [Desulfurivibrionaceae bacterium]|nr:hypothetical protein [Desulfurivibrionaceae bacterium]
MNWNKSLFLILTDDQALKDTLGLKLKEWGADVFCLGIGEVFPSQRKAIDVALIDVRQKATEALHYFNTIKPLMPFAEALIVNRSGNISGSIEGMRSGAGDELLVPFDTVTLRERINKALKRSRKRQKKQA